MYETVKPLAENPFRGQHILSVKQFTRQNLDGCVLPEAKRMQERVKLNGRTDMCRGCILANVFYEPSTRTSSSFTSAMERLGGSVIPINEVRYSSVAKGEDLDDMMATMECYADVIVLRHPETGSAALAAAACKRRPLINAGDGVGEHPTQALLDLFTIERELGRLEGLDVVLLGDLKHGRTVHSLARLLSLYGARLHFVSPDSLRMPSEIMSELRERSLEPREYSVLDEALPKADVLYVTRVQKERFASLDEYEAVNGAYVITPEVLAKAKPAGEMVVMHPLPRVGEIAKSVDKDPRAAYHRQMEYGQYMRMALLALVLGRA